MEGIMPHGLPYAPGQPMRLEDEPEMGMDDDLEMEGAEESVPPSHGSIVSLGDFLTKRSTQLFGQADPALATLSQDWLMGKRIDAPAWEKHAFDEWRSMVASQTRDEYAAPGREKARQEREAKMAQAEASRRQYAEETYQRHHSQQRAEQEADREQRAMEKALQARIKARVRDQRDARRRERHTINGEYIPG